MPTHPACDNPRGHLQAASKRHGHSSFVNVFVTEEVRRERLARSATAPLLHRRNGIPVVAKAFRSSKGMLSNYGPSPEVFGVV